MSTLDQIHEAINAHIAELQREIAALDAARAALRGESAGQTRAVASKPSAPTPRRRRVAKAASNGNAVATATASGSPAADVSPAASVSAAASVSPAARTADPERQTASKGANASESANASRGANASSGANASQAATASKAAGGSDGHADKARGRARAKPSGSRKSVEVLLAGKLEAMLRESEDGLSAITISKRSNARYTQVLTLLRELEGTGQVRRSGTRRTSLWRVVTDEERIAERAAELEALSAGKSSARSGGS